MKKLFASLFAAALLIPQVAHAGEMDDHEYLWDTLQDVGVTISVNSKIHCNDDADGYYNTLSALLVVCQDNMGTPGVQVAWTDNDLDTLRHEAHHVVQDCAVGALADGETGLFFHDKEDYDEFVLGVMDKDTANDIFNVYRKNGASELHAKQEVEAFAVASAIDARTIANKVNEFCNI